MKKKLSLNQMGQLQGGKFWGKECSEPMEYGIATNLTTGDSFTVCVQTCTQYVLWVKVNTIRDNGPCDSMSY